MEVPALGSSQARARAQAEEARKALEEQQAMAPELVLARYAYIVAYSAGQVCIISDLNDVSPSQVIREPTLDEVYGALVWVTHNADKVYGALVWVTYNADTMSPLGVANKYDWAFLVVTTHDGNTLLYNTLDVPVADDRPPTPVEVLMSAEIVVSDLLSSKTAMKAAQATVSGMMQLGGAMQQQMAEATANQAALQQAEKKFGGKPK